MKCPVDDTTLLMSERQGVEIDYCPQCRGVWLDRGELDKLLSRNDDDFDRERERYADRGREQQPQPGGHPKKRKRWLSEVLDFD